MEVFPSSRKSAPMPTWSTPATFRMCSMMFATSATDPPGAGFVFSQASSSFFTSSSVATRWRMLRWASSFRFSRAWPSTTNSRMKAT
jgi:hypothetical protein